MKKRNNKKGFTIVELVIVIAVIAILAAVLIPTFAGVIEKANLSSDQQAARNAYVAYVADADADDIGPKTSAEYFYLGKQYVITIKDEAIVTSDKVEKASYDMPTTIFENVSALNAASATGEGYLKIDEKLYIKVEVTTAATTGEGAKNAVWSYAE